ncbi:MAG: DegT/DnrJ/EryC1/StrS aminotransferase family protein [Christensenella sp.]
MKVPFSPPDITQDEIDCVTEALKSGWITTGPKTKLFETQLSEYIGTNKTVCLNSATAALELTLRVLGIGVGDEVITTAYTYTATASVICHVGATPVFVDVPAGSFHIGAAEIAAAVTSKTKAVIPVDIGGVLCDYPAIDTALQSKSALFHPSNTMQEAYNRPVIIADAAHSFGAANNMLRSGNFADFTCFSFHAVKNLTTAEGGAVTWKSRTGIDDDAVYRDYMLLSLHGQTKDALSKTNIGSWEYDIISPAYKCNMTDISASIGLAQLKRYDSILMRRKELVQKYDDAFKDLPVAVMPHYFGRQSSSGHLYLVRLIGRSTAYRNQLITKMAEAEIAANVHYKPLPMLTAYKNLGFDIEQYPHAFAQYENEITLPLFSTMTDEQQNYVIENFIALVKNQ